jgi:Protein of unknown function (DUF4199)
MGRTIITYGIIGGVIVAVGMLASILFVSDHGALGMVMGYLIMLIALSMIFVGVKHYRDETLGGVIRFWPALGLGLAIGVVAALLYVGAWEIYMAATNYSFMDNYGRAMIAARQADGASAAEIAKLSAEMKAFSAEYARPLYRMAMTFAEIAPVVIVVALVSAIVLRNPRAFPARA